MREFGVHIAIDDTYGPTGPSKSNYVTGARRTHVAVMFEDDEVGEVRQQLRNCLDYMGELLPRAPKEFHFVDVYNGYGDWEPFKEDGRNLRLIEAFGNIYANYRWPVMVQTIDDRTLRDHGIEGFKGVLDGLDLSDRQDLSLFLLCVKIKMRLTNVATPLTVIVDEGRKKSNTAFGRFLFRDRKQYEGRYAASSQEPLLQIADLLAFCINRMTHLSLKEKRTATDLEFMGLVNDMQIRSADLSQFVVPRDFTVEEIDRLHKFYRSQKGMRNP
jgi:hypothetical protein